MDAREEFRLDVECIFCSQIFKGIKRSKYCSSRCNQVYRRYIGLNSINLVCGGCGKHYIKNNKVGPSQSCSRACTIKSKKLPSKIDNILPHMPTNYFSLGAELNRMNQIYLTI